MGARAMSLSRVLRSRSIRAFFLTEPPRPAVPQRSHRDCSLPTPVKHGTPILPLIQRLWSPTSVICLIEPDILDLIL